MTIRTHTLALLNASCEPAPHRRWCRFKKAIGLKQPPALRKQPPAPPWTTSAARESTDSLVCLTTEDTGAHRYLSKPLTRGQFANYRVAVDDDAREFGVKQVFLPRAIDSASFTAQTLERTNFRKLGRERDMLVQAESALQWTDVLVGSNRAYCFMRRMQGDLFHVIEHGSPKLEDAAALCEWVLASVGTQLATAHAKGIIHQDVKLENVLWNDDADVILADYGCARRSNEPCNESGTLSSFSPERLFRQGDDEKADVWALGVLAIFLLCHVDNPFYLQTNSQNGKQHTEAQWETAARTMRAFTAWRGGERNQRFDRPFKRIRKAAPRLANFLEVNILDVNPKTRASAADVARFFGQSVNIGRCQDIFARISADARGPVGPARVALERLRRLPKNT